MDFLVGGCAQATSHLMSRLYKRKPCANEVDTVESYAGTEKKRHRTTICVERIEDKHDARSGNKPAREKHPEGACSRQPEWPWQKKTGREQCVN
jgi:hypothetical protein